MTRFLGHTIDHFWQRRCRSLGERSRSSRLPRCAGQRQVVGAVTEPHTVRRLLGALALAAQPPPLPSPPPSSSATTSRRRPSLPADPGGWPSPRPPRPALALAGPACRALESGDPANAPAGLAAGSGRGGEQALHRLGCYNRRHGAGCPFRRPRTKRTSSRLAFAARSTTWCWTCALPRPAIGAGTLHADRRRPHPVVPQGCAHGFLTFTDAIVHYQISEFHHPGSARGVRDDDRAFASPGR